MLVASHRSKKSATFVIAVLVVVTAAIVLRGGKLIPRAPKAVNGAINLAGWILEREGAVALNGQWEFYWRQLLAPADFRQAQGGTTGDTIMVPGMWDGTSTKSGLRPANAGYATYRLQINGLEPGRKLGLHLHELGTSYRMWVDGRMLASAGQVGASQSAATPAYRPHTVFFESSGQTAEIVVQVSNFSHAVGGFWSALSLGTEEQMRNRWFRESALDVFLMCYLLITGVYHLGLFLLRRREPAPLLLGLLCFGIALRAGLTGDMIIVQAFPLSWPVQVALQRLPVYVCPPLFAAFVHRLYPKEVSRKLVVAWLLLAIPFIFSVITLPPVTFTRFAPLWEIALVPGLLYVLFGVWQALRRGREGSFIFLIGTTAVVLAGLNDLLSTDTIINTPLLIDVGLVALTVCESIVLSVQLFTASDKIAALNQAVAEDRYRSIFEHTGTAMVMVEADSTISAANAEFTNLFGYPKEEVERQPWDRFVAQEDLLMMKAYHATRRLQPEGIPTSYECRMRDVRGRTRVVSTTVSIIPGTEKTVASLIDITQRKEMEESLRTQQQRLFALIRNLPCGVVVVGKDGTLLYTNPVAEEILCYTTEEIPTVQSSFAKFYPDPAYRARVLDQWEKDGTAAQQVTERIFEVCCGDGQRKHLSFGMTFLDDGSVIIAFTDVSKRVKDQELVRHLADHDFLTGLPNVKCLQERLAQDFARTRRSGGMLAVMFLDLDRFKDVNDTYGHQAGDRLLCEVALRLQTAVRESDTVGRIGGDEFCVLLPDITSQDDAAAVAGRIVAAFDTPCMVDGHEIDIYPSVGLAVYPVDGDTPEELMRKADTAMYQVKRDGTSGYRFSSDEVAG